MKLNTFFIPLQSKLDSILTYLYMYSFVSYFCLFLSFNNNYRVIIVLLTLEFPAMSSNTGLVNLSPSLRTITPTTTSTEN